MNPQQPIVDCRSHIHGLQEAQLKTVQFTLKHAQTALMDICSDHTIIVGHSVHNDLRALKFFHSKR